MTQIFGDNITFTVDLDRHDEFYEEMSELPAKSRNGGKVLVVNMYPLPMSEDMVTFFSGIKELFPNIVRIMVELHGESIEDDVDAATTRAAARHRFYDLNGIAALLDLFRHQLTELRILITGDVSSALIGKTSFVATLTELSTLLDFDFCGFNPSAALDPGLFHGIVQAIGSLKTLRKLHLQNIKVHPVAPITSVDMESLKLPCCFATEDWLLYFLEHHRNLKELYVEFMTLSTGPFGSTRLANAVTNNRNLKVLMLEGALWQQENPEHFHAFLDEFSRHVHDLVALQTIEIDFAPNTDEETLMRLFRGLASCASLSVVHFRDLATAATPSRELLYAYESLLAKKNIKEIRLGYYEGYTNFEFFNSIAIAVSSKESEAKQIYLEMVELNLDLFGAEVYACGAILRAALAKATMESVTIVGVLSDYAASAALVLGGLASTTTLQSLYVQNHCYEGSLVPLSESTEIVKTVQKNYSLKSVELCLEEEAAINCNIICSLNRAGRSYMLEDNSIENGVAVLSKIDQECRNIKSQEEKYGLLDAWMDSPSLDCYFIHLRENAGTFFPIERTVAGALKRKKRGTAATCATSKESPSPSPPLKKSQR
ncbi:MAG: hypothetical protein SGILL_008937 [Bacillariaceae sp.]